MSNILTADEWAERECVHRKGGRGCAKDHQCSVYKLSGRAQCPGYEPPTPEIVEARRAANRRRMELLSRGLSDCCEASIDTRNVVTEGRYKGHGPRYCSKCHRLLFYV